MPNIQISNGIVLRIHQIHIQQTVESIALEGDGGTTSVAYQMHVVGRNMVSVNPMIRDGHRFTATHNVMHGQKIGTVFLGIETYFLYGFWPRSGIDLLARRSKQLHGACLVGLKSHNITSVAYHLKPMDLVVAGRGYADSGVALQSVGHNRL